MKYKTIEGMRQTRLMITEVFVPGVVVLTTMYNIPAIKERVDKKVDDMLRQYDIRKYNRKIKKDARKL